MTVTLQTIEPGSERGGRPGTRLKELDGLRGLAIVSVMLNHFLPRAQEGPWWEYWLLAPFQSAWGTTLFFLMSGFFLVGMLLDAPAGWRTLGNYLCRRALRIWPLYYLILVGVFLVWPVLWPEGMQQVAGMWDRQGPLWYLNANHAVAAAGEWFYRQGPINLTPLWSVSLQEQFAVCGGVVVALLPRRWLVWVLGACLPLALGVRMWQWRTGASPIALFVDFPARLDIFALGGLLAMAARQPALLARLERWAGWAVMAGLGVWALLAAFGLHRWFNPVMGTVGYSLQMLTAAGVVIWLLRGGAGKGRRVFSGKILGTFGRYSFGLFCLHQLIWTPVRWCWPWLWGEMTGWGYWRNWGLAGLGILASLAVAWASYHAVEMPAMKLKGFFPLKPQAREWPTFSREWVMRPACAVVVGIVLAPLGLREVAWGGKPSPLNVPRALEPLEEVHVPMGQRV